MDNDVKDKKEQRRQYILTAPLIPLLVKMAVPTVIGTRAAVLPILVPTTSLVKLLIATIKMINGKDLNTLTIKPSVLYIVLLGFKPSSLVITKIIAIIKPIIDAIIVGTKII